MVTLLLLVCQIGVDMKKLLLILMIAFFMFSTCISAGACDGSEGCPPASNYKNTEESYIHNDSDQEVTHVDETYSKILQIYTVQVFMANPFGLCSGVVLGFSDTNTFILTCKHCVSVNEEVYVENKLVKGIITSADDDLAILIVDGILEDKHAVTLAKEKAKVDDIIFLIGYPNLDGSVWISKGQVLRYKRIGD